MSDGDATYDDAWEDYDSGPFCTHYGTPGDCEDRCTRCGHSCMSHSYGHSACEVDGCPCEEQTDDPPPPPVEQTPASSPAEVLDRLWCILCVIWPELALEELRDYNLTLRVEHVREPCRRLRDWPPA